MPSASPPTPAVAGQASPGTETIITIHLRNIPLLRGVDEKFLRQVAAALRLRTYEKGAHIIHKGGVGEHLIFILAGRVQAIDFTEDGKEAGLSFLAPGDYFGELSIIDGEARSASVVASQKSLLAFLPRVQALNLIYNNSLVAERVIKRLAGALRRVTAQRTILAIPNAYQRVFAVLNQFVKIAPGGRAFIEQMPTQQEIAIMANTSRETVSRAIRTLLQKGIAEKEIGKLIIKTPDALRRAGEGGELDFDVP